MKKKKKKKKKTTTIKSVCGANYQNLKKIFKNIYLILYLE